MGLQGKIETMPPPDLLQFLGMSRKTGMLIVRSGSNERRLWFEEGVIVSSRSDDPQEYLGQFLLQLGIIDEKTLSGALRLGERQKRQLGLILMEAGLLTEDKLKEVLVQKAHETIYNLFLWKTGTFEFVDGEQLQGEQIRIRMDASAALMEGAYRVDQWQVIRDVFPSDDVIVQARPGADLSDEDLEHARTVYEAMGGDSHTILALCMHLHRTKFWVYNQLLELKKARAIAVTVPEPTEQIQVTPDEPAGAEFGEAPVPTSPQAPAVGPPPPAPPPPAPPIPLPDASPLSIDIGDFDVQIQLVPEAPGGKARLSVVPPAPPGSQASVPVVPPPPPPRRVPTGSPPGTHAGPAPGTGLGQAAPPPTGMSASPSGLVRPPPPPPPRSGRQSWSASDALASARAHAFQGNFEAAFTLLRACLDADAGNTAARDALAEIEWDYQERVLSDRFSFFAVPRIVKPLSEIIKLKLSPTEAFLLSRINGAVDVGSIIAISPLKKIDVLVGLCKLLDQGIVQMAEVAPQS